MGGVVKEEDEELFYCLFQFDLVLSSCPGVELVVLFIVSAKERLMGVHLYTIIFYHGNLRLVLPFIPQALL